MTVNRNSSAQSGLQRVPDRWKRDSSAECEWTGELDGELWTRTDIGANWLSSKVKCHVLAGFGDATVIRALQFRQLRRQARSSECDE